MRPLDSPTLALARLGWPPGSESAPVDCRFLTPSPPGRLSNSRSAARVRSQPFPVRSGAIVSQCPSARHRACSAPVTPAFDYAAPWLLSLLPPTPLYPCGLNRSPSQSLAKAPGAAAHQIRSRERMVDKFAGPPHSSRCAPGEDEESERLSRKSSKPPNHPRR